METKNMMHIVCDYTGFIPQLNMDGPIFQPILVNKDDVTKMVLNGLTVSQYNPETKQIEKLDLEYLTNKEKDIVIDNSLSKITLEDLVEESPKVPITSVKEFNEKDNLKKNKKK